MTPKVENMEKISEGLKKSNPKEGTLVYFTSDKDWLESNGNYIEYIPSIEKEDFNIHIYRDKDNIFKVKLSTFHHKNVILTLKNLAKYNQHEKHMVSVTWNAVSTKLYVDGELVDEYPKK